MLTREDGKLDVTRMSAIVDQIVWLRKHDYEVILVSSGAVAAGRAELHVDHHLDSVEQRQLFSAIGQVKLVGLYYNLFREYNIKIGQVLTMKENFGAEEQYKNQEACMQVMLENNVQDRADMRFLNAKRARRFWRTRYELLRCSSAKWILRLTTLTGFISRPHRMTKIREIYRCQICGNVVEVVNPGAVLSCCGC